MSITIVMLGAVGPKNTRTDYSFFQTLIAKVDWSDILTQSDVSKAFDVLIGNFLECLQRSGKIVLP